MDGKSAASCTSRMSVQPLQACWIARFKDPSISALTKESPWRISSSASRARPAAPISFGSGLATHPPMSRRSWCPISVDCATRWDGVRGLLWTRGSPTPSIGGAASFPHRAEHESHAGMASSRCAFPARAGLDRGSFVTRRAAAAQRCHRLDCRHCWHMESVSWCRCCSVRAGDGAGGRARPGCERGCPPSHLRAPEMGDVLDACFGAVGHLARCRHTPGIAAILGFYCRAVRCGRGAGGDRLSWRPERVRIRRGRKANRRAVRRGTARRPSNNRCLTAWATLPCSTPARRP